MISPLDAHIVSCVSPGCLVCEELAAGGERQGGFDYRALHRDLVSRLGFGDDITEQMADNNTIVMWFEARGREADEWREHERFRDECALAGHDTLNDCVEHGPACCNRGHVAPPGALS